MKLWLITSTLFLFLLSCGGINSTGKRPVEDKTVQGIASRLNDNPADTVLTAQLIAAYDRALYAHMNDIASYKAAGQPDMWEKIMREYAQLMALNEAISAYPVALKWIRLVPYRDNYEMAKQNAAQSLYGRARDYLDNNDRQSAIQAYNLFTKVNQLVPGYRDVDRLMEIANEKSIIDIVINPVNYFNNGFDYYGFNNDFMQYQFINDLRYQLGASKNVRVYTDREAFSNNIYPDRVVDLRWNELYFPIPTQNTVTRQVSNSVVTGRTADGKPVYTTVYATLIITRRLIEARGSLSVRITDPTNNRTLMYEDFPGGYTRQEEYATYRGDSRALSAYDWAIINNSNYIDPTRNSLFNEVLRQVYPRLLSRIKSVTWYS